MLLGHHEPPGRQVPGGQLDRDGGQGCRQRCGATVTAAEGEAGTAKPKGKDVCVLLQDTLHAGKLRLLDFFFSMFKCGKIHMTSNCPS